MWQPEIVDTLLADETVSGQVESRVYLGAAPEPAARPYLIATAVGGGELQTSDGPGGMPVALVELAAVSSSYASAWALWAAATAAIAAGTYENIAHIEAADGPRDAPNVDGSIAIFAVVGLLEVAYR